MAGGTPRFELLTPRGPGGVAVVAVRGIDRFEVVRPFLDPSVSVEVVEGGRPSPRLTTLRIGSVALDQVLIVDRPASRTLELHMHGAPALVRALELAVGGFSAPEPRRAEALLLRAHSTAQLELGLEQSALDFRRELRALREAPPPLVRAGLLAAIERSRDAMALVHPQRVVLCGEQNAGKSTLMNRLLFAERVLTGATPGLTRDPVREITSLAGYPYELVDTAGEGPAVDDLGREAIERARAERHAALLLLLVVDGSRPPTAGDRQMRERAVLVRTKADLPAASWPDGFTPDLTVRAGDPDAAAGVRAAVGEALRRARGLRPAGPAGGLAAIDAGELAQLHDALEDAPRGTPST